MTPDCLWTCGFWIFTILAVLRFAAWIRCECLFTSGACRYRCDSWGWQAIAFFALAWFCHVAPALEAWLSRRIGYTLLVELTEIATQIPVVR